MSWSEGGGFQESEMVVELMEMTEKLPGGAVGAIGKDISSIYYYSNSHTLEISLISVLRMKQV